MADGLGFTRKEIADYAVNQFFPPAAQSICRKLLKAMDTITPLTAELEVTQKDNRLVYEAIGASQVSSRALYVLVKERLEALTAERDELKLLSEDLAVHLQLTLEQSCGAPGTHEALANYREAYPLSARAAKETR